MDNSQEEEPEAAEKLSPTLLSPVKTNSTVSRKCISIRAIAYIFFLTPKFPMIGLDQLKHQLGSVNISLDQLISVWIR